MFGNQAVADVMRKGAQNPPRLLFPPGREGQPLERDHRVAAPIGKPMVAGDDGADLIALGARPRDIRDAADRRDDKGVGRQDKFGTEPLASRRSGHA